MLEFHVALVTRSYEGKVVPQDSCEKSGENCLWKTPILVILHTDLICIFI